MCSWHRGAVGADGGGDHRFAVGSGQRLLPKRVRLLQQDHQRVCHPQVNSSPLLYKSLANNGMFWCIFNLKSFFFQLYSCKQWLRLPQPLREAWIIHCLSATLSDSLWFEGNFMFSRCRMSPIVEIQGSDRDWLWLKVASGMVRCVRLEREGKKHSTFRAAHAVSSLTGIQFRTVDSSHHWIQLPAWWTEKVELNWKWERKTWLFLKFYDTVWSLPFV